MEEAVQLFCIILVMDPPINDCEEPRIDEFTPPIIVDESGVFPKKAEILHVTESIMADLLACKMEPVRDDNTTHSLESLSIIALSVLIILQLSVLCPIVGLVLTAMNANSVPVVTIPEHDKATGRSLDSNIKLVFDDVLDVVDNNVCPDL